MAANFTISPERLAELAKLYKTQAAPSIVSPETKTIQDDIQDALIDESQTTSTAIDPAPSEKVSNRVTDKYGNLITYNSKQQEFIDLASSGKSAVLIGAAGTGKTTSQKGAVQDLVLSGKAGILEANGHKYLQSGTPGIVVVAYTRRAVANIKRNMPADMQDNCITIHKLLEYQPVYYEVQDDVTGEEKTKMVFEATRHAGNPLSPSIHTIIFEESSMLGTDLYREVRDAMPHEFQEIFLGDIQQLPPVFGPAILGFKLLELPTIELTEVYRQALESPIISLAHRILSGIPIQPKELSDISAPSKGLILHPWKKKIKDDEALATVATFFKQAADHGKYNPDEDMILLPFNKAFGTIQLNKEIANHLAKKRGAVVWEIIAGFNKYYFSVGDRVLFDKEDATIIAIEKNLSYAGAMPQPESIHLDYEGYNSDPENKKRADGDIDFLLLQVAKQKTEDEERVRACSHTITLRMNDSEQEFKTDKASDINAMLLGYALTVHKSQGSEWEKVFFVTHQSHATMLQRELIYTAVTRARKELYYILEPEGLVKGITSQKVKGNTLAEKAEFFKGRLERFRQEEE